MLKFLDMKNKLNPWIVIEIVIVVKILSQNIIGGDLRLQVYDAGIATIINTVTIKANEVKEIFKLTFWTSQIKG